MLDVHAPHDAAHSWKEFFIHVGTICVGLLIAIGLEQSVEILHQHHVAHHAREMIAREMAANDRSLQNDRQTIAMHEDYLFQDLVVIGRLRRHALLPTDHVVLFRPTDPLKNSAWLTAQQSGALALLPYDEIQQYAYLYGIEADFNMTDSESTNALQDANTMFYQGPADRFSYTAGHDRAEFAGQSGPAAAHAAFEDQSPGAEKLRRLTPAQVDRLEQAIQQAIFQDEHLINRCYWLHDGYKPFEH